MNQGVQADIVGIASDEPRLWSHLGQNYPNPFNPATTIRYSVAERGVVTLRIYNVAGQLVRTLVNEIQAPKQEGYSVIWNGKNEHGSAVATGVYFYQLRTRRLSHTKKMLLLR